MGNYKFGRYKKNMQRTKEKYAIKTLSFLKKKNFIAKYMQKIKIIKYHLIILNQEQLKNLHHQKLKNYAKNLQ